MATNDKAQELTFIERLKIFIKDEKTHFIAGIILIIISVYLGLSFISFFFSGGADQSLIENLDLDSKEEIKAEIKNWTGYHGALISDFFIAKCFGCGVFFPLVFLAKCGTKLLGLINSNLRKSFWVTSFFLLWSSFVLSFFNIENNFFNFGGQCGKMESIWMSAEIGNVGTFCFIVLSLIIFLVITYESTISYFYKGFSYIKGEYQHTQEKQDEHEKSNSNVAYETSNATIDFEDAEIEDEENNDEIENAVPENEVESNEDENIQTATSTNNEDEIKNDPIPFTIDNNSKVDATENSDKAENAIDQIDNKDNVENILSTPYDPTLELASYKMPTIDLLKDYGNLQPESEKDITANKDEIIQILKTYEIEIDEIKATVGPTITLYEIKPKAGIRISKIKNLEDDIALGLAALGIRIIAPMPGKGTVGIEVPNKKPQIVSMRSVLSSKAFQDCTYELPIALGKTITNNVFMLDLAKTPHLLIAGATGMGKSVGLNAIISSLLYKKHPSQMKFVMIDPKQVEFSLYSKIEKHYLAKLPNPEYEDKSAIITEDTRVIDTLKSLVIEMDNRYTILREANVRNIIEYNNKFISRKLDPTKTLENGLHHQFMPYIVVIIDEYGDLIMTAGKEIEIPITRIAQKARAVGIHMVIATQRPSVKIITGLIKANFPARIAFRVTSGVDSKTILDAPGAQQLIGRGDLLYSTGSNFVRVQCAFVDTPEVENIVGFIGQQQGYPEAFMLPYCESEGSKDSSDESFDTKSLDPLLREAAELVVNAHNGSTSNIQRCMSIGFNRAGRIMDQLEGIKVVGPARGSKPRDILVQDLLELDDVLKTYGI